jgi:hypothetical protein
VVSILSVMFFLTYMLCVVTLLQALQGVRFLLIGRYAEFLLDALDILNRVTQTDKFQLSVVSRTICRTIY